jgi:WS/DGAT/MGAT family acyltransferase
MDATLLYLETATSTSNIGIVCRFDGPILFEAFARDFECRRLPRLHRFRQVIAPVPLNLGYPTWEDDPNFDITQHLRQEVLDSSNSESVFSRLINAVMARRIDLQRSPWEITVVNGLEDGGAAIIIQMHHCITDGAGVPKVLDTLFDAEPNPFHSGPERKPLPQSPPLPGALTRVVRVFQDRRARRRGEKAHAAEAVAESPADKAVRKSEDKRRLQDFGSVMKTFMQTPGIRLPFNAPLSGRSHYSRVSFDLRNFRLIGDEFGCTINDVLLTILGGAIDRQAHELGIEVDDKFLRVYQAADTRNTDEREDWGNRLAFMPALVPLGLLDPIERLRQTTAYTKNSKSLGIRDVADKMVRRFQATVPPPLAKLGIRIMLARVFQKIGAMSKRPPGFNIYLSNARLPKFHSFLGERRMTAFTGFGPLVPNTGVTCTAVNYGDRLYVGISADSELMPNVDDFASTFRQSFEELLHVANGGGASPTVSP